MAKICRNDEYNSIKSNTSYRTYIHIHTHTQTLIHNLEVRNCSKIVDFRSIRNVIPVISVNGPNINVQIVTNSIERAATTLKKLFEKLIIFSCLLFSSCKNRINFPPFLKQTIYDRCCHRSVRALIHTGMFETARKCMCVFILLEMTYQQCQLTDEAHVQCHKLYCMPVYFSVSMNDKHNQKKPAFQ